MSNNIDGHGWRLETGHLSLQDTKVAPLQEGQDIAEGYGDKTRVGYVESLTDVGIPPAH